VVVEWQDEAIITGWRKVKHITKEFKSCYRQTSNVVFKGRDVEVKKKTVKTYLQSAEKLIPRFEQATLEANHHQHDDIRMMLEILCMEKFIGYAKKFIDQIAAGYCTVRK
jgi:hypothetical protein